MWHRTRPPAVLMRLDREGVRQTDVTVESHHMYFLRSCEVAHKTSAFKLKCMVYPFVSHKSCLDMVPYWQRFWLAVTVDQSFFCTADRFCIDEVVVQLAHVGHRNTLYVFPHHLLSSLKLKKRSVFFYFTHFISWEGGHRPISLYTDDVLLFAARLMLLCSLWCQIQGNCWKYADRVM